jgi:hypothetical protein
MYLPYTPDIDRAVHEDETTTAVNAADGDYSQTTVIAASPYTAQVLASELERQEWEQVTGNTPEQRMAEEQRRAVPGMISEEPSIER